MVRSQFLSRGARGGDDWPDYGNEPRYRPIKAKFGGGLHNILRWTPGRERLYPSLTDPRHPEHIYVEGKHSVRMGSSVPYALAHQLGQGRSRFDDIPLPKRPMIVPTVWERNTWIRAIQRYIGWDKAGTGGIPEVRRNPHEAG